MDNLDLQIKIRQLEQDTQKLKDCETVKFLNQLLSYPTKQMKTLIQQRGVNTMDEIGNTMLHYAMTDKKYMKIAKFLLNNRADVNKKESDGDTPLHTAAAITDIEYLKLLCDKDVNINVQNNKGKTPLHMAIGAVRSYISAIAPFVPDTSKANILSTAKAEACSVVTFLLKKNADPNIQDNDGCTPLHLVAQISDADISTRLVNLLVDKGAKLECKDNSGKTPLHIAIKSGYLETATALLNIGADIEATYAQGHTALYLATASGQIEIVKLLLKRNAKVDAREEGGNTPLCGAVGYKDENESLEITTLLLDGKADINVVNSRNGTPLHFAVLKGHPKVIKLLLDRGAAVNVASGAGYTPLDLLIKHNKVAKNIKIEIMNLLLDKGATSGVTHDSKIMTALSELMDLAVYTGYQKVVEFLMDSDTDLKEANKGKNIPLHMAVQVGHVDVGKVLRGHRRTDSITGFTNDRDNVVNTEELVDDKTKFRPLHLATIVEAPAVDKKGIVNLLLEERQSTSSNTIAGSPSSNMTGTSIEGLTHVNNINP